MFVFDNLSNKEKLALATTGLILLVVVMSIISSLSKKESVLNYSKFNINEAINISEETFDRQTYLDLTNIVRSLISSYNLEIDAYNNNINYDVINYKLEDYYYALSEELQKYMSKEKYIEVVKNMCKKFVIIDTYGEYIKDNPKIIKNVYIMPEYIYGKGLYICSLDTELANTTSYIGIKLDNVTNKYNIFYLE